MKRPTSTVLIEKSMPHTSINFDARTPAAHKEISDFKTRRPNILAKKKNSATIQPLNQCTSVPIEKMKLITEKESNGQTNINTSVCITPPITPSNFIHQFNIPHSSLCLSPPESRCTPPQEHANLTPATSGQRSLVTSRNDNENPSCSSSPSTQMHESTETTLSKKCEETIQMIKLRKQLQKQMARNAKLVQKVKTLNQRKRRDKQKIESLKKIVKQEGKAQLYSSDDLEILKKMGKFNEEFLIRQLQIKKGLRVKRKYGPDLRAFASTLHYFSPRAYRFVRKKFGNALPHPKTITRWYLSIEGQPGFTKEAFKVLAAKARSTPEPLYAALCFDEMAIRKHIDKSFEGYVDMGEGTVSEDRVLASQALVFMVTSLNGKWKIPVGYFLIKSLTADAKAGLVGKCLTLLHAASIRTQSLTFDGISTNQTTAKTLGCSFKLDNFKPWFPHPDTGKNVYIFFDPCHMMKLVRNTYAEYETLYNSDGAPIHWKFIKELHKLQETEGLHLANKIRGSHLNYQRKKMNVRLAVQVLSLSASKALNVCRQLELEEFEESAATSDFLERFDTLFDILNSKSEKGAGNRKALSHENKEKVFSFFEEMATYIKGLHSDREKPDESSIVKSDRKTGFLGLLVCMKSTEEMFKDICEDENSGIKVLKLYRLSQDHIELFFGIIRARGGWNNNPTARHFKASYKRVLTHFELDEEENGNCIPLESISLLYNSSASRNPDKLINLTTNHTYLLSLGANFEDDPDDRDPVDDPDYHEPVFDADEVVDHFYTLTAEELTLFTLNVVTYMAGFVVKTLVKSLGTSLKCSTCIGALTKFPVSRHRLLLDAKNRGKLVVPGKDVVAIAEDCEKIVRRVIHETHGSDVISKENSTMHLTSVLMRKYIQEGSKRVFQFLDEHELEQEPLSNHRYFLIRCIAIRYFDLRLHHVVRGMIRKGESQRHYWNKLILFAGH